MPTRSYYFPKDFKHLEEILLAEPGKPHADLIERFRELGVPPIPSDGALPIFLGISPKTIFSIRRNPRKHYRSFTLRKKDGSRREIDTPRTYLKVIQWWILDNILNHIALPENVFGFVMGRSAVQNAEYHLGATHILNVDIKQFFPSITIDQVRDIYVSFGYSSEVSKMLAELCCLNECVPQGAPTSPAIANLVLRDLDKQLNDLAIKAGLKYSRYADDLTFSSASRIDDAFRVDVEAAVLAAKFELKSEKTRFSGQSGRMEVTGIVINQKLQPSRTWRKKTRSRLHHLTQAQRILRSDVGYLNGIRGMSVQFSESPQMLALANEAGRILKEKSETVIGLGTKPILPNGLTIRQANTLSNLGPRTTNADIASILGTTEAAVKKRLQEAFKKIDVSDRVEARKWAKENL